MYYVMGVRQSQGVNILEGRFSELDAALKRLDDLAGDEDCILAEVQHWPDAAAMSKIDIVAQCERINGQWIKIDGELRERTRAGDARDKLREVD